MQMRRVLRSRALFTGLFLCVLGCGGAEPKPARAARTIVKPAPKPAPKLTLPPGVAPVLPATDVASLEGESAIPFFARRGPETLLMYADQGRFKTRLLPNAQGSALPEPTDAGEVLGDVHIAAVRAVESGYLAAWIEPVQKNSALKMMPLDAAGKPLSAPVLLLQSADEISWIEILPNGKGALLAWETNRDRGVDVDAFVVSGGKTKGAPKPLARAVLQWQAIPSEQGAALAIVEAPPLKPGDTGESADANTGRVLFSAFDVNGQSKAPLVVSPEPTAFLDLDIAEVGDAYVLAWTDRNPAHGLDSRVLLAAVSKRGQLTVPPHPAGPPMGDQALVSLASSPYAPLAEPADRALLAWEDTMAIPVGGRRIRLAAVGSDATLGKDRASMVFASSGPPDLTVFKDGFAALTLAPALGKEESVDEPDVWPTYVRFGRDLNVLASEPVRALLFADTASPPYVPYMVRGLSCYANECGAFAQDAGGRSKLAHVSLPVRENAWKSVAFHESEDTPPRARSIVSRWVGDSLGKITAVPLASGGVMVSHVGYRVGEANDEGEGEKNTEEEGLGTLGLLVANSTELKNTTDVKSVVISKRAVSIGGVAMAAAPAPSADKSADIAVAWVAREKKGEAQVFVTKVNEAGEKLAQRKVTVVSRKAKSKSDVPSECSDVAIAFAGPPAVDGAAPKKGAPKAAAEGFVLAWVDTRDGNAEVYVAKVDRQLNKIVPDRRVTSAPGDSAEVQILVRGKETWLLFSDARQHPDEGYGDIYWVKLDTQTLQKLGPESRLFASAGHSRTPMFFGSGIRVWASWIEEGAMLGGPKAGDAPEVLGLHLGELDGRGGFVGVPALIQGPNKSAVGSYAIGCEGSSCKAVLGSAVRDMPYLFGLSWTLGQALGAPKALGVLSGGAMDQDLSPVFSNGAGNSVFFIDNSIDGSGRVRQLFADW